MESGQILRGMGPHRQQIICHLGRMLEIVILSRQGVASILVLGRAWQLYPRISMLLHFHLDEIKLLLHDQEIQILALHETKLDASIPKSLLKFPVISISALTGPVTRVVSLFT